MKGNFIFRVYSRIYNIIKSQKTTYFNNRYNTQNVIYGFNSSINMCGGGGIRIGNGTTIEGAVNIFKQGSFEIGTDSYIGEYSKIFCFGKVTIGNNVLISHSCTIMDSDTHSTDYIERHRDVVASQAGSPRDEFNRLKVKNVTIGNDVWIGCNSIILKGITIGDRSIIAAGSVVNKDVPSDVIFANGEFKEIK